MAAGKTTVGRLLAERLGYEFVDLDREVERRAGRPVPEIFRDEGEAAFRSLEAEVTRLQDSVEPVVMAAGGGWMARPELRSRWPDAVRVWLRVSPGEAVVRLGDDLGSRPMLDPADPEASARTILEERAEAYGRAEIAVETDALTPREVAGRILASLDGMDASDGMDALDGVDPRDGLTTDDTNQRTGSSDGEQ